MKEIVWVFGTSASGKETFIKSALENVELRARFGWTGKIVQASQNSIRYIGQSKDDPIVKNRELIIDEVQVLLKSADVVLVKWQLVDSAADRLQRLQRVTPGVNQRIIKLETIEDELVERLNRKPWWHDRGQEKEFITDEIKRVDDIIAGLTGDFELIRISGTSFDNYELGPQPMSRAFSFDYFGSIITARSLGLDYIPPLNQTITAHCFPITEDGKIVAVDIIDRGIDVPGGHIDDGETAEAAMCRETHEEAFVTVEEPILIDVWKLWSDNEQIGLTTKPYLLLYVAKVKSIEEFIPNNEVRERFMLTTDEFVSLYFGDKEIVRQMIMRATDALSEAKD